MVKLWIGGSSCLAETYFHAFPDEEWVLIGLEDRKPQWVTTKQKYCSVDLVSLVSECPSFTAIAPSLPALESISEVVVGIRPPLVCSKSRSSMMAYNSSLAKGLTRFLEYVITHNRETLQVILHISSVAAVDHTETQHNLSEVDTKANICLTYPYDIFKANCEGLVGQLAVKYGIAFCNLRLSAIFSDSTKCIQCSALHLQSVIGTYTPHAIDANSSRNVSCLIRLILQRFSKGTKNIYSVYYYTRPLRDCIRPYGDYLKDYRKANGFEVYLDIPYSLVAALIWLVHALALFSVLSEYVPFLSSIDYLLQVSSREHSFDMSRLRRDFPDLSSREESIEECFRRRTQMHSASERRVVQASLRKVSKL